MTDQLKLSFTAIADPATCTHNARIIRDDGFVFCRRCARFVCSGCDTIIERPPNGHPFCDGCLAEELEDEQRTAREIEQRMCQHPYPRTLEVDGSQTCSVCGATNIPYVG